MGRPVAVIGAGQTRHGRRDEVSYPELVREAVLACLADAGVAIDQIDAVVTGSMPAAEEGVEAPELWLSDAVGIGNRSRPLVRVATCGTTGMSVAHAAYYHVASGMYDLVLAVGMEKMFQGDPQGVMATIGDPMVLRPFLGGAIVIFGLGCQEYIQSSPVGLERVREAAARISARSHKAALANPYAHMKLDVEMEDVLNSRIVSYPMRLLDCCPASDGACAVLFASEPKAKQQVPAPAWVKGVGYAGDEYWIADKTWVPWEAAQVTAQKAYAMAGIRNPRHELDVAELYVPFSFMELMLYEDFGFCGRGEAHELVEAGVTDLEGELPVVPSGGVLCTNPIGATGLIRVAEAALQVMGRVKGQQVPGAKTALAHAMGGTAQFNGMMILSRTL
jgi:acetyl-CoA C-acetyltransferase